jgi:hypothetical protein
MARALEEAKNAVPDFDKDGVLDQAFAADYQFTPDVFMKRFPSFDEYLIHKLSGNSVVPFISYDDAVPLEKVTTKQVGDLKRFFTGPLDIIRGMFRQKNDGQYNGRR